MIIQITGDTGGLEPYDIYLCDPTNVACFYISGLTSIPATVEFDSQYYFPNEDLLYLRIVDTNGCIYSTPLDCVGFKAFQDVIYFKFMDDIPYAFQ